MEVERYEHKGYTIVIETDDDPLNPRKDFDHAGTMCCEHREHRLGDGGVRLLYDSLKAHPNWEDYERCRDWGEMPGPEDTRELLEMAEEWGYTVLPLYLYDHSGITMSCAPFSCPWDSGQVGIIFMSPQTAHKEGITDPVALLKAEVEEYDMFLTGQVYGYRVLDDEGEELDSCWGFFGDEYVKQEGERMADWYVKENGEQLELEVTA